MSQLKSASQPTGKSPKNIVVFGESGVGKSSLINLIAGGSIAATSNDVKGCTSEQRRYDLELEGTQYAFWDTAGLDEGSRGTVPAKDAKAKLRRLLHELTEAGGVHLLIYCVRASHSRRALLRNYNLVYSVICRKKVPIVLVANGLERDGGEMEDWWTANKADFEKLKMHFDGHACVTTVELNQDATQQVVERSRKSREDILSMIANTCSRDNSVREQGRWRSTPLADVRATIKPTNYQTTPIVTMYELSEECLDTIGSAQDRSPFEGRLMDVAGDALVVYRIRNHQLVSGPRFDKQLLPRRADLLIFCASICAIPEECRRRLDVFYQAYDGDTRPLLIVVKDATTEDAAREWWNRSIDPSKRLQVIVCALPSAVGTPESETAVRKLQKTIQTRASQPVEVAPSGCFAWLRVRKHPVKVKSGGLGAGVQEEALTNAKVWVPRNSH